MSEEKGTVLDTMPAEKEQAVAKKDDKAKKDSKKKGRFGKWFRDLKAEGKKIVWPSAKQVVNNTLVVIACVIVVGICIWVFDFLFQFARDLLIQIG